MCSDHPRRFNSGFVRFLSQLNEEHPDPSGAILIHGPAAEAASYVEISEAFGFTVWTSESSAQFIEGAEPDRSILCVLFVVEEIETDVRDHFIKLCETAEYLYALQITSIQGDLPGINREYKIYIHNRHIIPGNPAADRVDAATKELFSRAYKDVITDKSPDWMMQELRKHNKLD